MDNDLQIPAELWKTLVWISKYYICPLGIVLKTAIPLIFKDNDKPKKIIYCKITSSGKNNMEVLKKRAPMQYKFLSLLEI